VGELGCGGPPRGLIRLVQEILIKAKSSIAADCFDIEQVREGRTQQP
jgi:hypothetical protein